MSRAIPPSSRNAPGTASGRPTGTATRLTTAAGQRPVSRGGPGSTMRIKVEDTPMTRGGLGGIQANASLAGRQVMDRTYYVGLVRSKVNELETETNRLQKDTDSFTEDNKQYSALSKAAEELSQQIESLRNELGDYNMIIDRLQTSGEVAELKKELMDLTSHNHQVELGIDEIYVEKRRKEDQLHRLERDLADEKKKSEKLLANMNPELKQRYSKIKSYSDKLQQQMDAMQNEISTLEGQMNTMREQMSGSVIKQDALSLVEQLHELETKREQLQEESKNSMTPDQEQQKLTQQVREENQEIASMERQIKELKERNESLKREYQELDNDRQQSITTTKASAKDQQPVDDDTTQKYFELKKKEQQIDEFIESYAETKEQNLSQLKSVQKSNLNLVQILSRGLMKGQNLPSKDEYSELKSNLENKESEKKKSNDTNIILKEQHRKLKQDYDKLETLDQRLNDEREELKTKWIKMQEDLEKFSDLEGLKKNAEKRKLRLAADKINMAKQRQATKLAIQMLHSQYEAIQGQVHDNDTHQQLVGLEKTLQTLGQSVFTAEETLSSQNAQGQYEQIKRQALDLVQLHNRWLTEKFANSPVA
ncbi:unnamed protein product [Didymodactylos carnosus]|uniref:Uncharacterized protein n=1 Tax=Didymodactylos carnosus TaxID=1234261 RepID=A0A814BV95_9BILA|nr:unnamed protein product [Didymodactylos carnosus]CAF0934217.1 unnamed protein product [Didymodactylos carnosus]CAF3709498.1 unnamed protein product [Didymodactylos carnosus]CAF3710142.1 unnamed protein product [Didymodactylos carnosus]